MPGERNLAAIIVILSLQEEEDGASSLDPLRKSKKRVSEIRFRWERKVRNDVSLVGKGELVHNPKRFSDN